MGKLYQLPLVIFEPKETTANIQRQWNQHNEQPNFGPPLGEWKRATWLQERREIVRKRKSNAPNIN